MIQELLEEESNAQLKERKDELNHRRHQLSSEYRDEEELIAYQNALDKTFERLYDEDKKADPGFLVSRLGGYSDLLSEVSTGNFDNGIFVDELLEMAPTEKEEFVKAAQPESPEEDLLRLHRDTDALLETASSLKRDGYNDPDTVQDYLDSDKLDKNDYEDFAEYFNSFIESLNQPAVLLTTALMEEAKRLGGSTYNEVKHVVEGLGAGRKLYKDSIEEVEELKIPDEPTELLINMSDALLDEYEEKIEHYESKEIEKDRSSETREEKDSSIPDIEERVDYDFSVIDQELGHREKKVVEQVVELDQEHGVKRRDMEDAFNWAWTDSADLEQPELDKEVRSRLKDLKKEFEKYIERTDLDSNSFRRDKPEIENLMAAGKRISDQGIQREVIEKQH